jgi:hypothetical protein
VRNICGSRAISSSSASRIYSEDRFVDRVNDVIGDEKPMMAHQDDSVKIMQTEEAREEKSTPPEWVRNPGVQIIIVPWWRIVRDYRRTFFIVIVVYYGRVKLGLIFSVLAGATRHNGQPELICEILKCFQGILLPHRQLFGIRCSGYTVLQLADNIRGDWVIGDPPIHRCDSDRGQDVLSLCLIVRRS